MNDFTSLNSTDLQALATALRKQRLALPPSAVSLRGLVSQGNVDTVINALSILAQQGFSLLQIALLIELVLRDRASRLSVEDAVQFVTTGPEAGGIANRDTSAVVRDLFSTANESVMVVGYAIYQGQRVFQSLAERMCEVPSLKVRLFLDIQRPKTDTTAPDALAARFIQRFKTSQWPTDKPMPLVYYYPRSLDLDAEKHSCLHAKCVVIDGKTVFISSANFTEAAQERNIEVGVLIESETLAHRITKHFNTLLDTGLLSQLFK